MQSATLRALCTRAAEHAARRYTESRGPDPACHERRGAASVTSASIDGHRCAGSNVRGRGRRPRAALPARARGLRSTQHPAAGPTPRWTQAIPRASRQRSTATTNKRTDSEARRRACDELLRAMGPSCRRGCRSVSAVVERPRRPRDRIALGARCLARARYRSRRRAHDRRPRDERVVVLEGRGARGQRNAPPKHRRPLAPTPEIASTAGSVIHCRRCLAAHELHRDEHTPPACRRRTNRLRSVARLSSARPRREARYRRRGPVPTGWPILARPRESSSSRGR